MRFRRLALFALVALLGASLGTAPLAAQKPSLSGETLRPTGHRFAWLLGGDLGNDIAFDPAMGATVEIGLSWLALTYTNMKYVDDTGGQYDASNVGVSLTWLFGKR